MRAQLSCSVALESVAGHHALLTQHTAYPADLPYAVCAPSVLPPAGDVLSELRAEAVSQGVDPHAAPQLEVEAECAYYSPTDDMVMEVVSDG